MSQLGGEAWQWNDGYGADSSPSREDLCRFAIRPSEPFCARRRDDRFGGKSTPCGNDASRASLRHTREGAPSFRARLAQRASRHHRLRSRGNGRSLDLGMSEEQLDRSQIAGLTVDLRRLGTAHRMRAIGAAVRPGALDPALHDTGVLAGCHMRLIVDSARKNVGASIDRSQVQPVLQRCARLLGDLELHWTASLVLDNCGPVSHVTTYADVIDPKADKVAAPELAVDGEVEQREIACAVLDLKSDTNGPDLLRPQGTLLADETALVPRRTRMIAFRLISVDMVDLHVRPLPPQRPHSEGGSLYRNSVEPQS